jgi:hypothetical protein
MKAQLYDLLYALQRHDNQIIVVYFLILALAWPYWVNFRPIFMSKILIAVGVTLAILVLVAYILTLSLYLLWPNYFDQGQPVVASISWLWMHGHDLYPNLTTGDIYGLAYGPVIFLINGMALLLSPTIFASKLTGVLSLGAVLGTTLIILKQKTNSNLTSLIMLASQVMLFVSFGQSAYSNRPEPFLTLISVLTLLLAFNLSPWIAGVGVGVLAGLASGLKLYGFIYAVPAAFAVLARVETLRCRFIVIIIGGSFAVALALLPYFEKGVSIAGYMRLLGVALHHGWSLSLFYENLRTACILVVPITAIWILRNRVLNSSGHWLLAGLCFSVAMITVIAAKPGGGTYYLLPLVPICIYGIAFVLASKAEVNEIATVIFLSLFLAYGPRLYLYFSRLEYMYQMDAKAEREKIAELKTYLTLYPEAQIGISDDRHNSPYFYRIISVLNGRPLNVDFAVWADLAFAGVDEEYISRFIKGCVVPTWILPLGTPFTMINFYNDRPILSEGFRKTFFTNYQWVQTGGAYQIWRCNYRLKDSE